MKLTVKLVFTILLSFSFSWSSHVYARSYVRYVTLADLNTKAVYADSVLTSIELPQGTPELGEYPQFNAAIYELEQVLEDPNKELLQVWVCGSSSPDGLWANNVRLSKERTDAAADYLKNVLNIPVYQIHKENLNEDWDRLSFLVANSDIPCRDKVLDIIATKQWGERKTALQKLQNGAVWDILVKDFFPKLRCVRFAIFCKWTPDKPRLSTPRDTVIDTVYVRDTVYLEKLRPVVTDSVGVQKPDSSEVVAIKTVKRGPKRDINWLAPHVMAVKTNLLSDAMAIPSLGVEVQLVKGLSLDVSGAYGFFNVFNKTGRAMSFYNVSPELRWWFWEHPMQWGSFFGLHANVSEFELAMGENVAYQSISGKPAWSAGFSYGVSACLDKNAHWGLEFVIGVGYGQYYQNIGTMGADGKFVQNPNVEPQIKGHYGLTKLALNLVYRFSLSGKK